MVRSPHLIGRRRLDLIVWRKFFETKTFGGSMVEALPPGAFNSAVTGNEISMPCGACKARFCCLCKVFISGGPSSIDLPGDIDEHNLLAAVQKEQRFQQLSSL